MAVETLYRVICSGGCERYLPKDSTPRKALEDTASAALFVTVASAYDEAVRRGWSRDPLRCPDCTKEADVNNKTAGLYVKLANTLNALEEAGEDLDNMYEGTLRGTSARVDLNPEGRWVISEEGDRK